MKSFISKILDQPQSQPVFKFVPQIKISPKSTLHLQIQPKDPHTASNIVVNAYQSKTNRSIVPIKVQWSRYKFKSEEQFTVEKIPSLVGNTYMCEPSDLGSVIQAKVKCLDPTLGGQAEATIGPIRIDPVLKRLIDGALYNQTLLSQIIVVEGEEKLNINLRMGKNTMEFTDINSSEKLAMPYSLSEPKLELSPKDPCKVYLRFEQDANNKVRTWLNKITNEQKNASNPHMNQSSLSMKIPHSNVSSLTSKTKLFQRSHVHCVNKLEVRFLSRNSRDLFLFTLRAFVCKQDMKNSVIMQRIQTLQGLKSQQDYHKFLEYISLKSEIIRLAEIAKELQHDRDSKVKDITNMEESISEMTLTYLKIIEEKSQQQHVDLEQSYSMISMKREQIMGRKNLRELKAQNQKLKLNIRQLNQQLQLQKFFKKDANQHSMVFNQTTNPFLKKQNISGIIDQNHSYYVAGQEVRPNDPTHKNMLEISKSYLKVLEENKMLRGRSGSKKGGNDQSMGIENLLESLHESQQEEKRMAEVQEKMEELRNEVTRLNEVNKNILIENTSLKQRLLTVPPLSTNPLNTSYRHSAFQHDQSFTSNQHNNTSMISNSYMSMNQSMTSEAELVLLEKKLIELSNINAKFEGENARLRRERDYFRSLYEAEINKSKTVVPSRDGEQPVAHTKSRHNVQGSMLQNGENHDSSMVMRLKEQRQKLQNEKNSLMKKIDSLTRESNAFSNKPDPVIQKRLSQLTRHNQRLIQENESLKKTVENMKSFHELEKRQMVKERTGKEISGDLLDKVQEVEKLKKVNASLLNEIKELRMEVERKNDLNLDNSRVIDLQNQLSIFKTYANGTSNTANSAHHTTLLNPQHLQTDKLITQLTQSKKQNTRLKEQITTLQLKIQTQTSTIQKLMAQIDQLHSHQMNTSNASSAFNRKYLTPQSSPGKSHPHSSSQAQAQKYKKKLLQVQAQLQLLKRNSSAVNRSRDLSMSMMGYDEERLELYKKQNESLMVEVDNLNKMCSKYSKDAREANLELNKLKAQTVMMNKAKLDISD